LVVSKLLATARNQDLIGGLTGAALIRLKLPTQAWLDDVDPKRVGEMLTSQLCWSYVHAHQFCSRFHYA
jgi:hypothetical protein